MGNFSVSQCTRSITARVGGGPSTTHRNGGFTLIELAIVIGILGAMLGAGMVPLATRIDMARVKATRNALQEVRDALTGFAIGDQYNRLPCPDIDRDGIADPPGGPCTDVEGHLPWATLGIGRMDAWVRPLRYRADNAYTAPSGIGNPPDSAGSFSLRDRHGASLSVTGRKGPAAIVFSCGKNGIPDAGNDADGMPNTQVNCANPGEPDGIYIQDIATAEQFDDILVWLPRPMLLNRLVAAQKWP